MKKIKNRNLSDVLINETNERISKLIKKFRISFAQIEKELQRKGYNTTFLTVNDKISGKYLEAIIKLGNANFKKFYSGSSGTPHISGNINTVSVKRIKLKNELEARKKKAQPIRLIKTPMGGKIK